MEKTPNGKSSKSSVVSKSQPSPAQVHSGAVGAIATELDNIHHRDFFQELMHRSVDALERNLSAVLAVIGVLALAGAGWLGWGWIEARGEKAAQEKFYPLEKQYAEKRDGFERAKFAAQSKTPADKAAPAVATGDLAKDYGDLVDGLESFAKENAGSAAGVQAGLLASQTRLEYSQTDKAMETLKLLREKNSTGKLMGLLVRMAEGNALAANEKCADALSLWQQVLEQKSATFLHGEASLRAGICLESMGQKDRAIEMYKKASADGEQSATAQSAKSLLRRLEVGT